MDKAHRRGYKRMAIMIGALALVVIEIIGTIHAIQRMGIKIPLPPMGFWEIAAMTIWVAGTLGLIVLVGRKLGQIVHNWARLMGER